MGPRRPRRILEVRLEQIPPALDCSLLLQSLESIPQREEFRTSLGDYAELAINPSKETLCLR